MKLHVSQTASQKTHFVRHFLQINMKLPRSPNTDPATKSVTQNLTTKLTKCSLQCMGNPRMSGPSSNHEPVSPEPVCRSFLVTLRRRIVYGKKQHFGLQLSLKNAVRARLPSKNKLPMPTVTKHSLHLGQKVLFLLSWSLLFFFSLSSLFSSFLFWSLFFSLISFLVLFKSFLLWSFIFFSVLSKLVSWKLFWSFFLLLDFSFLLSFLRWF